MNIFKTDFFYFSCHCVKSVRILSFSSLCFPALWLNRVIYSINLIIQLECWKIRAKKSPDTDNFYAVGNLETQGIILFNLQLNCGSLKNLWSAFTHTL